MKELTFSDIIQIVNKEKISGGIYCHELKIGYEIKNLSELNNNNSNYVSNDYRIISKYTILEYSIILLEDYKCRFCGASSVFPSSNEKVILVLVKQK